MGRTVTVKTQKLDENRFRKVIAELGSESWDERNTALTLAHEMAECSGMVLYEAINLVFGTSEEASVLKQKLDVAEARINQLQTAPRKTERKNETPMRSANNAGHRNLSEIREYLWGMPQIRLLLILLLGVFKWIALPSFKHVTDMPNDVFRYFWIVASVAGFAIAGAWTKLEFKNIGIVRLLWKWTMFFAGNSIAVWLLCGCWLWDDTHMRKATHLSITFALLAWAITYSASISHLCDWLSESIREHVWESDKLHRIRDCF